MKLEQDYYSARDVAFRLGVSKETIYRYIDEGSLKAFRLAAKGNWRISRESLKEFLEFSGMSQKGPG